MEMEGEEVNKMIDECKSVAVILMANLLLLAFLFHFRQFITLFMRSLPACLLFQTSNQLID